MTDDHNEECYRDVFPNIGLTCLRLARRVEEVTDAGYSAILNVCDIDYGQQCFEFIHYVQIPLSDSERCIPSRFVDAAEALHEFLQHGHRVLVHCEQGISRSPSVIALYLVRHRLDDLLDRWGVLEAQPLPREFTFFHGFLGDAALASHEGLNPGFLMDPIFGHVVTAFRFMSFVRPDVYLRPAMWNTLFPGARRYLAKRCR